MIELYTCKNGLIHDKKCNKNRDSRSNNGFKYSADGKTLGFKLNEDLIFKTFSECSKNTTGINMLIYRLPNKSQPPLSIDELIGLVILGLTTTKDLEKYGWYFQNSDNHYKDISMLSALKTAWKHRKEHRNFFWENDIKEIEKLAYKIMPWFRYFIKKQSGEKTTLTEFLAFNLYCFSTIMQDNISAQNLCWLMLKNLKSKFWIKGIDIVDNYKRYFGEEHPFYLKVSK